MDKFQNPKTIGDGTYGSVLKAVNSQNGKCDSNGQAKSWRSSA